MASSTRSTTKRSSGSGGGGARSTGRPGTSSTTRSTSASRGRSAGAKGGGKGGRTGGGTGGGKSRPPGLAARAWTAVRSHLAEQRQDVIGTTLILLGVLAGLGMYASAAGPVGDFLEAVFRGLLGLAGFAVPVLLAWFGLLVVLDRPSIELGRIGIGSAMIGLGALGGWHLAAGVPGPADGMRELWPAGGLLGWLVARPLELALSPYGATAVFVALVFLGSLIVTRTPFSVLVDKLRPSGRDGRQQEAGDEQPTEVVRRPAAKGDKAAKGAEADQDDTRSVDEEAERRRAARRATLAKKEYEQPELAAGQEPGTAADREAGRAPDPPTGHASVPAAAGKGRADGKAAKVAPVTSWEEYQLPPMELLANGRAMGKEAHRTIEAQTAALQETFEQFGVDATVARWSRGPTVTRFEIELGPGVQVKKVANMGDDIAYALAAPDVRIVAPIPGKSAIGVEVPNRQRDLITLGDILRTEEATRDPHPLTVAMGVDIAGNPALVNLATMPHLLVSGATGSGKSVTVNGMISSVIMRARPDQVRMILIDPKRVELNHYAGAPHLLSPVVTDPKRATDAVQWCVKEMEQRYELLAHLGYRNIDGYNEAIAEGRVEPRPGPDGEEIEPKPLPYILLVIDELADLMLVAPRDVEDAICRIAQMARAVGIHMVIATQRPSVDVITGLIKANIPSRLALAVASQTDSRTILDIGGAEKLVGKGDMLFMPASQGKPSRLQGCWVTEREIESAVSYCRAQREVEYVEGVTKQGGDADRADASRGGDDDSDQALLRRAAEQVVTSGLGSTSMLQRKLRVGFARAGRLMDDLEELGVVGPNEGSKAREVLWSPEELDEAVEQGRF